MHIEKLKQDKIDQENRIKRKKAHKQAKKVRFLLDFFGKERRRGALGQSLIGICSALGRHRFFRNQRVHPLRRWRR